MKKTILVMGMVVLLLVLFGSAPANAAHPWDREGGGSPNLDGTVDPGHPWDADNPADNPNHLESFDSNLEPWQYGQYFYDLTYSGHIDKKRPTDQTTEP